MGTTIPQRELRNHHSQIIDRVSAGESFTVTRNGVPIADVIPHVPSRRPPRFRSVETASTRARLNRAEAAAWLADIAAQRDQVVDPVEDPWERQDSRG